MSERKLGAFLRVDPEPMATSIMLDSGAFSAWKKNLVIDFKKYMAYLKRNAKHIDSYVNLDVRPGKDGKYDSSPEALEAAASASFRNYQIMLDKGFQPIPVFHQGEQFRWFERMLELNASYIGFAPQVRAPREKTFRWLDDCFSMMTDSKGRPLIKAHGLGITSIGLCAVYPWFSTDATSWSLASGMGQFEVPRVTKGGFDYTLPPIQFHITSREGPKVGPRSFDRLPKMEREIVLRYIKEVVGVDLFEVRNSRDYRTIVRVKYYQEMEKHCGKWIFERQNRRLWLMPPVERQSKLKPWKLTLIYSSLAADASLQRILNRMKVKARLLSFNEMQTLSDGALQYYAETGLTMPAAKPPKSPTSWDSESYRLKRRFALANRIRQNARKDADEAH